MLLRCRIKENWPNNIKFASKNDFKTTVWFHLCDKNFVEFSIGRIDSFSDVMELTKILRYLIKVAQRFLLDLHVTNLQFYTYIVGAWFAMTCLVRHRTTTFILFRPEWKTYCMVLVIKVTSNNKGIFLLLPSHFATVLWSMGTVS